MSFKISLDILFVTSSVTENTCRGKPHQCKLNPPPPNMQKRILVKETFCNKGFSVRWVQSWHPKRETDKHLPRQTLLKWVCAREHVGTREERRERGFTLHPKIEKELNPWAAQPESSHGERFCRAAHHKSVNYRVFFTGNFRGWWPFLLKILQQESESLHQDISH